MRRFAVILLAIAGCGQSPDAEPIRLAPGTKCVVILKPGGASFLREKSGEVLIKSGDRAQVISDEMPSTLLTEGKAKIDVREVQVVMLEGETKGQEGSIERCYLVPESK